MNAQDFAKNAIHNTVGIFIHIRITKLKNKSGGSRKLLLTSSV